MATKKELFLSTAVAVDDIGEATRDPDMSGVSGRLYCRDLWIEDTNTWAEDVPGFGRGKWYTCIGSMEYQSDDLAEVEAPLFRFALSEGYLDYN